MDTKDIIIETLSKRVYSLTKELDKKQSLTEYDETYIKTIQLLYKNMKSAYEELKVTYDKLKDDYEKLLNN